MCAPSVYRYVHRASVYGVESWGTVVTSRKPGSISRHAITTLDSPSSLCFPLLPLPPAPLPFFPFPFILETLVCLFFPSAVYSADRRVNGPSEMSFAMRTDSPLAKARFFLPPTAAKRPFASAIMLRERNKAAFDGTIRENSNNLFREATINLARKRAWYD